MPPSLAGRKSPTKVLWGPRCRLPLLRLVWTNQTEGISLPPEPSTQSLALTL
ncbi:hypothetical protein AXF42_Ash011281 [Apostasia shenzhenica]|uniref:Uncharacterized protein n=1 Tax=Apostasia shenzhenica TaxID=1088818 RepID=A0A2I0AE29_9ASPA|nr:hypothetical protein AXF42_Ash011281 [Apostasia shenzhenica]